MKQRKSIVKYPGGKAKELDKFIHLFQNNINNYIEPFIGGGSVYLAANANQYFINDFSKDLINLYFHINNYKNKVNDYNSKLFLDYLNKIDNDLDNLILPSYLEQQISKPDILNNLSELKLNLIHFTKQAKFQINSNLHNLIFDKNTLIVN